MENTFNAWIEIYRYWDEGRVISICRKCAENIRKTHHTEFDIYANRYPSEFEMECDCGEEIKQFEKLQELLKIENVIY